MDRAKWLGWLFLVVGLLSAATSGCRGEAQPANHLSHETSPYLLQHAHNPVDWYPWGEEALRKARDEKKPIFLSIGYSSCHWCHVMEAESFENAEVAAALNRDFVAIKVDREERPDLDEVYITTLQMMNGSAGWPATLFLTPEGKPFFGATYLPRADLLTLLGKVKDAWANPDQRRRVTELADRFTTDLARTAGRLPMPGAITPQVVSDAARACREGLDPKYGGFSKAPKFPPSARLAAILAEHERKADPALLHAVTLTLDRMERGGIHDQIGGGFHRYSTDEKWLVPHFEKMLYDNAMLAWVYLLAYRATREPRYRRTAVDTLDFVLRDLSGPSGELWSSLDADSPAVGGERREGAYYTWTPSEIAAVLGPANAPEFERCFGITAAGQLEGRSIPNLVEKSLAERAAAEKRPLPELERRLAPMLEALRAARAKRPRPSLDDKVLAAWNGLMLRALALGYDVTGEARFKSAAERCATFLLDPMRPGGRLAHSYRAGRAQPQAFLEDYGAVGAGLVELYRATGDVKWLAGARSIVDEMIARCWDEKKGMFSTSALDQTATLVRTTGAEDGPTPSPQSLAALALAGVGREAGESDYRQRSLRVLSAFATDIKRFPIPSAGFVLAGQEQFRSAPATHAGGPVKVALEELPQSVQAGQVLELRVQFHLAAGWHVNAPHPSDASLIPTKVELEEGSFRALSVKYPEPKSLKLPYSTGPVPVLTGDPVVTVRAQAPKTTGEVELRLTVRYQPCNDRMCDRPVETRLRASITVR